MNGEGDADNESNHTSAEDNHDTVAGTALVVANGNENENNDDSSSTRFPRIRQVTRRLSQLHRRHRRRFQGLIFIDALIEGLNHEEVHPDVNVSLEIGTDELEPPLTKQERRRDKLLEFIANSKIVLVINVLVLVAVVAAGAVWFFFIFGWQTLCRPRTDCEPRNQIYNISIQVLTGLFTWMCTIVMPWRCTHMIHTFGVSWPHRSNAVGCDLYGLPDSDDPWFHVPRNRRIVILLFLFFNSMFQYANQISRGFFWSYEDGDTYPGSLWTTLWFMLSLGFAFIAAILFWKETSDIRQTDNERFGAGPIEMMKEMYFELLRRWRACRGKGSGDDADEDEEDYTDHAGEHAQENGQSGGDQEVVTNLETAEEADMKKSTEEQSNGLPVVSQRSSQRNEHDAEEAA